MKKIYYLKKKEVKIGELVEINGVKLCLTEDIIKNNLDLFIVEENKKEVFKYVEIIKIEDKLLFTTFDGVKIFDKDTILYSCPNLKNDIYKITQCNASGRINHPNVIKWNHFSTAEARDKWVKENSEKTLQDYEYLLIQNNKKLYIGTSYVYKNSSIFYQHLKNREGKLYWTKVLQIIADDLNEGWNPDWESYITKWAIYLNNNLEYTTESWINTNLGNVIFKNKDLTQRAIKLMGDKLDFIYK